jgi:hypothetical protein
MLSGTREIMKLDVRVFNRRIAAKPPRVLRDAA